MDADQERVRNLLKETVVLLCKNGLKFQTEVKVQGLLGITLDASDVFLVQIDERIAVGGNPAENAIRRSCSEAAKVRPLRDGSLETVEGKVEVNDWSLAIVKGPAVADVIGPVIKLENANDSFEAQLQANVSQDQISLSNQGPSGWNSSFPSSTLSVGYADVESSQAMNRIDVQREPNGIVVSYHQLVPDCKRKSSTLMSGKKSRRSQLKVKHQRSLGSVSSLAPNVRTYLSVAGSEPRFEDCVLLAGTNLSPYNSFISNADLSQLEGNLQHIPAEQPLRGHRTGQKEIRPRDPRSSSLQFTADENLSKILLKRERTRLRVQKHRMKKKCELFFRENADLSNIN